MENSKSFDVLDMLTILAKHKKFIILITILVSIVAVVYSLLAPMYWISKATIMPAEEQTSSLSLGSSSLLGLGSSLLGGGLNFNSLELMTIMNSRTFTEKVINHFNLVKYFEISDPDSLMIRELALEKFRRNVRKIGMDEETGLISINIETKDRYLSANIANYHWLQLEKYNIETRMSKGKQQRVFLEKRITEVKGQLDLLSNELMKFQEDYNVIEIDKQTSMLVDLYSNLIVQKTEKEIELEYVKETLGQDNPLVEKLEKEKDIIETKITDIEVGSTKNNQYILKLNQLPELTLEYSNIKLNLKIQTEIYNFLYPQYEQAKIKEIQDMPTIEVVDKAVPMGRRSKPKRAQLCIMAFVLAFIISSSFSIIADVFNQKITNENYSKRWSKFVKYLIRK